MPRTAATVTTLTANANTANPAGNAVDPTNGHIISGTVPEEIIIEINSTFAGAKNFTVKAGANPPALAAGQGDLVVALNAVIGRIGPLTSARFIQADGSIWLDVESAATGTIKVFSIPRTA